MGRIAPLVAQVAQRGVTLAQRLGVALQRRAIVPVHLAQRVVQIAASAGRRAGDQLDVLRHKEHDVQPPGQVGAALACPIHADGLLQPCRAVRQRSLFQDDLNLLDTVTAHDLGPHAGVGQPFRLGLPVDELAVERGEGRGSGGEQVDRLQQAGLALGVRAVEEQRTLGQGQFQAGIVAEIGQAEVTNAHGGFVVLAVLY